MIRSMTIVAAVLLGLYTPPGLTAGEPSEGNAGSSPAGLERSKEVVRAYYQRVWNEGDLAAVDELFSSDYDREGLKDTVSLFEWGFPDRSVRVVDLIGEGDRVVAYWIAEARHEGKIFGIEPTGAWVTVTGIEIFHIEDGKIFEDWQVWDRFGLVQQLREASDSLQAPERDP